MASTKKDTHITNLAALEKAAEQGGYLSVEELQSMSGVSSAVMETLRQAGALGDLPDSNQLSFF